MTLKEAADILASAGIENARAEARSIFAHIGNIPDYALLSPLTHCDSDRVHDAIKRRSEREPLQYILGEVNFYRENYRVTPDCLIPRSDTEVLVEYAVRNLPSGARFLDLCTGSGCIAISTLCNTDNTTAIAVDISKEALDIAGENAERNNVASRLELMRHDVTEKRIEGEFFAVLSNPPYVTDTAYTALEKEIYYEPKAAFVGGHDGGDFYRAITPLYKDITAKGGFIAYEIGYDQRELLESVADENGMSCEIIFDLGGNPRVAVLKAAD